MRHDVMKDADVLLKLDGPSFWDGLLNDRARKTLAKLGTKATRLDLASEEEALGFFAQANESLTLAAEASIRRMLQKNPNLVNVQSMDAQLKKKEIEIEIHMTTLKQKIEMMSNFKKMSEETKEKLEKAEETNVKIEKRLGILE